jgi:hypothetical protein
MKDQPMKTPAFLSSLRKPLAASALALTSLSLTAPANATGVPTTDVIANFLAEARTTFAESQLASQVTEFIETATRWQATIQHYRDMVAGVMNISLTGLISPNRLQRISDISSFTAQACPGSGSLTGALLDFTGFSSLNLTTDIAATQRGICQKIAFLEATKYNETVDMLNRLDTNTNSLLRQLQNLSIMNRTPGDIASLNQQSSQANAQFAAEATQWQGKMNAYDSAIATLKSQQTILANKALKGSGSSNTVGGVVGNLVQGATFAAALSD